jgi:hypothetical protein
MIYRNCETHENQGEHVFAAILIYFDLKLEHCKLLAFAELSIIL